MLNTMSRTPQNVKENQSINSSPLPPPSSKAYVDDNLPPPAYDDQAGPSFSL
eukprot:Pgem_evm1s8597